MTNSPILRFHILGEWEESRVRTVWGPGSHFLPPEALAYVEQAWSAASARPEVKLFDGPMCRLENWSEFHAPGVSGGNLQLVLSRTSYKQFVGTNLSHPELADRYGREVLANPVGVSPALETADGFLMLGRRNDRVAYYPSRIHPFAGCLEPVERHGSPLGHATEPDPFALGLAPSVFAAVRRELFEELGFTDEDISEVRCTGIAEDVQLRQPELIFRVKSPRSRREIESRVAREEHHESWSIPTTPDGVEPTLTDPRLTPVAVASLLLWGRQAFGQTWFEAHSAGVSEEGTQARQ